MEIQIETNGKDCPHFCVGMRIQKLGMEFFAIKMNGSWFLGVVVKSFVLDVAVFSNLSVNRLVCIRFNISKGVSLW